MGEAANRTRETWIQWLMFVGLATIYLWFPTRSYFFDGISFAQIIEENPALHPYLFHPNHLVYNLVGSIFFRLLLALGINLRAVEALQILNSLLSVVSAYVLFVILKSVLKSRYLCYALTLLFAFSATWWKFSTDADAYIPSVLFLLISFYLALPNRKPRPLVVALIYSISLCFHQIAIISFPVLVVALFLQDASLARQRRIINALVFSGTAAFLTLSAYAYSFYRLTQTFNSTNFVRWVVSYAPDESFGFHAWNNLRFTLRGHSRLFFGGKLNASKGLLDPFMIVLIVVLAALFLVFAFQVIRHFRKPGLQWLRALRQDPLRRTLALLCLLWISLYLIFLFFLFAHHTFYRLFYLPALVILLGLCLDSLELSSRRYRLVLFVAILCITNFVTLIFPYSHVKKYPPLVLALEMNQVWPPGTVIYYGRPSSDTSLVRYFNPGMIWTELGDKSPEVLEAEIREASARGDSVWLETSAIDQLSSITPGAKWLEERQKQESLHALISKAHNIRFVQVVSADK